MLEMIVQNPKVSLHNVVSDVTQFRSQKINEVINNANR